MQSPLPDGLDSDTAAAWATSVVALVLSALPPHEKTKGMLANSSNEANSFFTDLGLVKMENVGWTAPIATQGAR